MSFAALGQFPHYRPRRLRQSPALRRLVEETSLRAGQLVLPLFVRAGKKLRLPVKSMPGVMQLSPDQAVKDAAAAHAAGVAGVILFGIPERKDEKASGAWAAKGVVMASNRARAQGPLRGFSRFGRCLPAANTRASGHTQPFGGPPGWPRAK